MSEKIVDLSNLDKPVVSCFYYSPYATTPQIPSVTDVLYVLGLSKEDKYYGMCERLHRLYVDNVNFVLNVVGFEVAGLLPCNEAAARRAIARAIIDLCPEKARCLFNPEFVEAKVALGEEVPPRTANVHERRRACDCQDCRQQSSTD